jgi:rubrerythrin
MSDKPSYLGLLNAIVVNEARGHALYAAWAATTKDPELARTLQTVAIRECEHAAVFTKRLCELGYEVREKPAAADFESRLAMLRSDCTDAEKFERVFGYCREAPKAADRGLAEIFDDRSIDPLTGALLGRFVAEEHDSLRRLQAAYDRTGGDCGSGASIDTASLDEFSQRLERIARTIRELKAMHQTRN